MPSPADTSLIIELSDPSFEADTDIHAVIECLEDALRTIAESPPIVVPLETRPYTYIVENITADFIDRLKIEVSVGLHRVINTYDDLQLAVQALDIFLRDVTPSSLRYHLINRLRVFRRAHTAHLGRGVGQERWLRVGASEKYAAR